MNKSAETAIFMAELEKRGLYDPRNPAGPLPTSLRPLLNQKVGGDGVDPRVARAAYRALSGGESGPLSVARLDATLRAADGREEGGGAPALDYYSFQGLMGRNARVVCSDGCGYARR